MSALAEKRPTEPGRTSRAADRRDGIRLVVAMVTVMWVVEIINAVDSQALDNDGIVARNVSHLWGILTAPFLHAGFGHLIGNTIPLLVLGVIVALRAGVRRLVAVTAIVILVGGLGTWLIAPTNSVTIGASGLVFGYATYLLSRGFFNRSLIDFGIGALVFVLFGLSLLASLIPHYGVSWQGHLCGGLAGILAAWLLAGRGASARRGGTPATPALP